MKRAHYPKGSECSICECACLRLLRHRKVSSSRPGKSGFCFVQPRWTDPAGTAADDHSVRPGASGLVPDRADRSEDLDVISVIRHRWAESELGDRGAGLRLRLPASAGSMLDKLKRGRNISGLFCPVQADRLRRGGGHVACSSSCGCRPRIGAPARLRQMIDITSIFRSVGAVGNEPGGAGPDQRIGRGLSGVCPSGPDKTVP